MTMAKWLILVGAAGLCLDTVGWVLIFLGVMPEYPYFPIALACFVVYFTGRILYRRDRRRSFDTEAYEQEEEGDPAGEE